VDVTRENGVRFLRRATANEREKLGIPSAVLEKLNKRFVKRRENNKVVFKVAIASA
jgi:hypothetical protein